MRIIAGKARRTVLKTIEGQQTRPTTDRIKETLFNIINTDLIDCKFLDLFSGSGAIGIEALSRGAASAVFVENNKAAVECIHTNLKAARLIENSKVITMDVIAALKYLEVQDITFDIIFMDPPYNQLYEKKVLETLQNTKMISTDTIIIVEASLETEFDYLENTCFEIYRQKEYKTNKHVFIGMRNRS
jgi:16S rRNA (guanine(966)-N(2))-methyltransferase RsmD